MTPPELNNRFDYHEADCETRIALGRVRELCKTLASELDDLLPQGRETALVMTNIEQVMFWACAAVARRGK